MQVEFSPEQEVLQTEYLAGSEILSVVIDQNLETPFLKDKFEPIVDCRETLQATQARFESPFFTTDEIARAKLLNVVELLTIHKEICKAMWQVDIDGEIYIYTFEEQFDETGNLISVITYALEQEKKLEIEEFKISENVHMVTLQKTEQQVYIKSEADLHAEFVTLKESGIKVSGYSVRLNEQGQIEALFGGDWYNLEDVVVKDSEMYLLLKQVTKAVENGQTAFTVTTHGISAGTSKKFEIKIESAEYIINIFDVANGRVYNYILVDKSLQDVQQILAKYGIELNLENPDLTFGAVNNFNKEEFEKDNFGHSLETNADNFLDFSSPDVEFKSVIPSANSAISESLTSSEISPANWRTIDLSAQSGDLESLIIPLSFVIPNSIGNPEITNLQEIRNKIEDEPIKPNPFLDKGLLLIVNTTENGIATAEQSDFVSTAEFEKDEATSTFGVDVASSTTELGQNSNIETAWQVYALNLETDEITDQSGVNEVQFEDGVIELLDQVEQEQNSNKMVEFSNETVEQIPRQSEILQPDNVIQFSEIHSSVILLENDQVITQAQNVDFIASPGLRNKTSNTFTQELRIAEQVVLLQEQSQSFELEYVAKHLRATVADFRWSNNLTEAEARAIQKDVEAKTGRTVIEIRTSPSGKLQVITL